MKVGYSTISISKITMKKLKKKRIVSLETYDEIINRILDEIEKKTKEVVVDGTNNSEKN